MLSLRGSSQPRDRTQVSCIAGGIPNGSEGWSLGYWCINALVLTWSGKTNFLEWKILLADLHLLFCAIESMVIPVYGLQIDFGRGTYDTGDKGGIIVKNDWEHSEFSRRTLRQKGSSCSVFSMEQIFLYWTWEMSLRQKQQSLSLFYSVNQAPFVCSSTGLKLKLSPVINFSNGIRFYFLLL